MLLLDVYFRTLKQVFRSPTRLSIVFFFPLGFTFVFWFMFGGAASLDAGTAVSIGVINNDEGVSPAWEDDFINYTGEWSLNSYDNPFINGFGKLFVNSLIGNSTMTISNDTYRITEFNTTDEAMISIKSRSIYLAIEISTDFSKGVLSGINSREIIVNGLPLVNDTSILNTNLTINLIGDPSYMAFQDVRTDIENALKLFKKELSGFDLPAGNFNFLTSSVASYQLTSFDFFIAGFFIFGMTLASGAIAGVLGEERSYRTLDRLKLSKMKSLELMGGIALNQFTISSIQLAVMFGSAYILGFNGIGDPFLAFGVALLTTFPVLGLGFLASGLVPDGRDAMGVIAMLSAPIGFLSGAFLPIPDVPLVENLIPIGFGNFRALQLWDFFPFYPSVSAIRKILLYDYTLEQVLSDIILLLAGGIIFFIIGSIVFVVKVLNPEK